MGSRVPLEQRSVGLRWYYANRDRVRAKKKTEYAADPETHKAQSIRWRTANPEKARAIQKRYRDANPGVARESHWRRAGIDVAAANALLKSHDGLCAICGTDAPGGNRGWHVDHCHDTKRVRGMLCCGCNLRLGWYEKYSKVVRAYLLRRRA